MPILLIADLKCCSVVPYFNLKILPLVVFCSFIALIKVGVKGNSKSLLVFAYLANILNIKLVKNVDEAIIHIQRHGSGHSEAILSENYSTVNKFLSEVDAACVYANASTRFTDGGAFGLGAEVGISTNKLHSRGPMGINDLTTFKYKIYGQGQIR